MRLANGLRHTQGPGFSLIEVVCIAADQEGQFAVRELPKEGVPPKNRTFRAGREISMGSSPGIAKSDWQDGHFRRVIKARTLDL